MRNFHIGKLHHHSGKNPDKYPGKKIEHPKRPKRYFFIKIKSSRRGILFEFLAAGCNAVSGYYTDNQFSIYTGFKEMGAITDAIDFSSDNLKTALKHLNSFDHSNIIDGLSPMRILNKIKSLNHVRSDIS